VRRVAARAYTSRRTHACPLRKKGRLMHRKIGEERISEAIAVVTPPARGWVVKCQSGHSTAGEAAASVLGS
jgi:hypothetical protein